MKAKATAPTDEQLKSIDQFIEEMDLTSDSELKEEPFQTLLDPGLQMQYRAIAHRAINPDKPVLKVDDEILALVKPPKRASNVDELLKLFPLKAAKLSHKEAFLQNILKVEKEEPADAAEQAARNLEKEKYHDIHAIGTINPADDFIKLLDMGEAFNDLAVQIQNVIIDLVVKSIVAMDSKVLQALLVYRETAREKAPFKYNEWISKFKDLLKEREKIQLWQSLAEKRLGLITGNESEMSTVSEDEAALFYKVDDFVTQRIQSNDNDIQGSDMDMFDDM